MVRLNKLAALVAFSARPTGGVLRHSSNGKSVPMRHWRLRNWNFGLIVATAACLGWSPWITIRPAAASVFTKKAKPAAPLTALRLMSIARVFDEQRRTQKAIELYRNIL